PLPHQLPPGPNKTFVLLKLALFPWYLTAASVQDAGRTPSSPSGGGRCCSESGRRKHPRGKPAIYQTKGSEGAIRLRRRLYYSAPASHRTPRRGGESTPSLLAFATSDLYNWKAQNPKFSEKPAGLIDLLDSVLFTHQPTWDDCRQLLQVLFTTEERERILNEARKLVPGADGNPTTNQAQIEASFPLTRPQWDFNTAEGKERLRVYRQTLMGGLRMAARKPTNLAKVGNVQQGKDESPAAFLERIMEAFRTYTPMDPEAPESKAAVIMAFVNQSAIDIRRKLQKIDRLGKKSLQDLLVVAEKVYNNREPPEDKQARAMAAASSKQTRDLARILLATTADFPEERDCCLRQLADDARKVFTDTFSGWVEAYPTKHETAQTVAKKLLEDILP
uniref:Core shell protein Gag P30 domain-containing protein n=1 Tax=Felis catus TaxID=9685 RepID=A0ABI7WIQ1_FELCA